MTDLQWFLASGESLRFYIVCDLGSFAVRAGRAFVSEAGTSSTGGLISPNECIAPVAGLPTFVARVTGGLRDICLAGIELGWPFISGVGAPVVLLIFFPAAVIADS